MQHFVVPTPHPFQMAGTVCWVFDLSISFSLDLKLKRIYKTAVVAQSVRAFASHGEGCCSKPSRYKPKSLKQVVTAPLLTCECHGPSEMTIINGCLVSPK